MTRHDLGIRALSYATDIDVLPDDAIVHREGDVVIVRTPSAPTHYWGNFLLFDAPPQPGDRERWEARFARAFDGQNRSRHRAFGWDVIDGELGAAQQEFVAAGYQLETAVALIATEQELRAHARASDEVTIVELDPADGADADLWHGVQELQVETRDPGHTEEDHRRFVVERMAGRRRRFQAGDGAWFAAVTAEGEVAASCGIVVTDGRARYQAVDTAERFRRRGIATRLVYDVGRAAFERMGAEHLVIVAEAGYHALPLYESLGFVARERAVGVCWWPTAPNAHLHPTS